MKIKLMFISILLILGMGLQSAELNVLTDRSDVHLKEIVEIYNTTSKTKVNLEFVENGLIERAKNGNYDIIITKDSSEVIAAKDMKLLKPISKKVLKNVEPIFKDKESQWVNISYRIRAIYVKKGFANPPMNYEDLAKPEYKGQICIRPLTHNYNLELFGTMLSEMGTEKFSIWLDSFKNNLARKPAGNDRNQVKAMFEGECNIGIVNTYYYGLMMADPKQKEWAESVDMIIPNQDAKHTGAISLFSALGVLSDKDATPFIKYLLSDEIQKYLSTNHYEYPLDKSNASDNVKKYGEFNGVSIDNIKHHKNIQNELFEYRKDAYKILKQD